MATYGVYFTVSELIELRELLSPMENEPWANSVYHKIAKACTNAELDGLPPGPDIEGCHHPQLLGDQT